MTWNQHHTKSEEFAMQAEHALKRGDQGSAKKLYLRAAEEETQSLSMISPEKQRTIGITSVSAASLWFKAGELRKAEQMACQWLAVENMPPFAMNQLKDILQAVWTEKTFNEAGVEFSKGDVLVRIAGGAVVHGGAPLDLIHLKVDEVRGFFYRAVEMLLNRPLRKHGAPNADIQEHFCPWLIQAPAGSYQFAVRVQKPTQLSLFPDAGPEVEEISRKVLEIVAAAMQEDPSVLEKSVPNQEYRDVFLKLTRNLAPTGKTFKTLEMRSTADTDARPVVLTPESRHIVNTGLRERKKAVEKPTLEHEEQIHGVLRALHLDKDWIEVALSAAPYEHVQIYQTGDVIDDIVGPLVNRRVIVDVVIRADGKMIFRDIQSEE